jgi:allophanate hydrolase
VADGEGHAIEAEVWEVPTERFGEFVVRIQSPLGIGTVQLQRMGAVKGFLCENRGTIGAEDISHYGGWRAYAADRLQGTIK